MSARSIRRSREREDQRRGRRISRRAGIAIGATAAVAAAAAPGAQAANFTVTSLNNTGAGSLRSAIASANAAAGADTITFTGAGASGEIRLLTDEIPITDDLTITGPGAAQLSISGDANNDGLPTFATSAVALGDSRIFNISDPTSPGSPVQNVSISGLTLKEGVADSFSGSLQSEDGGAIYSVDTALSLANVNLNNNVATGSGGAVYLESNNAGTLTISGAQISNNRALSGGGAILSDPEKYGPGDPQVGTTIVNSQITNNRAGGTDFGGLTDSSPEGGGLAIKYEMAISNTTISGNTAAGNSGSAGGAYLLGYGTVDHSVIAGNSSSSLAGGALIGSVQLRESTVSGNTTSGLGGGLVAIPFGSKYSPGPSRLSQVTVSGNSATGTGTTGGYGAGVASYGLGSYNSLVVRNSTIASNTGGNKGAGIFAVATSDDVDSVVVLKSSIVADNVGAGAASDLSALRLAGPSPIDDTTAFSAGFSLVETPGASVLAGDPAGTNVTGIDPQLQPLANNGGPTQTQALALTSPAIDSAQANGFATDQAGQARTVDAAATNAPISDGTDMGAFEVQNAKATGGDPDTAFKKKPPKKLKLKGESAKVKLKFTGTVNSGAPGALKFECKIDKGKFEECKSPLKLKLAKGKHVVEVRAVDSTGRVDSTPAKAKIKVAKKKPKK